VSTPFRLRLPRPLHDAVIAQARAEYPNECCGLLAGRVEGGVGLVVRRYPLLNALASPTEFESEPRGLFEAEKDRRRRGLEFLAVYHSHPTSAPVPSRTDLARNYYPDTVWLIVSLADPAAPLMRGWWLREASFDEAEWEVGEPTVG
jgi:[CysO sulfur-carrier protein]-S-L-cysteine hydrolase